MDDYLTLAKSLALQAGDIMLKYFDTSPEQHEKEDKQIVTIADEEINALVIQEINKKYPDHSIIGEEASDDRNSKFIWLCDPIDGTIPYSKGIPVSVFSLALIEDGVPIMGVVYDPFMKKMFYAQKGMGAFVNDKKMNVSMKNLARHSIIDVEWYADAEFNTYSPMKEISDKTNAYLLHLGSTTHAGCYVAMGVYEASIFPGTKGKAVDIAAVKIIVEEAGGKVTDLFGNEQRYDTGDIKGALVSNGVVHDELVKAISIP